MMNEIKFPTHDEIREIATQFANKRGFPGVAGCVDGTFIPIQKPSFMHESYYTRKRTYAVQAQVTVDVNGKIIDLFTGYPGSVHDSRVFENSPLKRKLTELLPENHYILADSGYPLTAKCITPFKRRRGNLQDDPNVGLRGEHKVFNKTHARARVVVEHAIGRWKGRWRIARNVQMRSISRICQVITASAILHNFAERSRDYLTDSEIQEMKAIEREERNKQRNNSEIEEQEDLVMEIQSDENNISLDNLEGNQVRNILVDKLVQNYRNLEQRQQGD
jgi:hypothetical protein